MRSTLYIYVCAVLLLLGACSPCKQAQRSLAKCPDLAFADIDTFVMVASADTAWVFDCGDTIRLETDRIKVELLPYYIHDTTHSTITRTITRYKAHVECKADTVRLHIPGAKTIMREKERTTWHYIGIALAIALALIVIVSLINIFRP